MARRKADDDKVVKIPQKKGVQDEGAATDELIVEHAGMLADTFKKKSDAQMAHASAGRAAKKDGVHTSALKKAQELQRMDPIKASKWLGEFHRCCELLEVGGQGDMLDQVDQTMAL